MHSADSSGCPSNALITNRGAGMYSLCLTCAIRCFFSIHFLLYIMRCCGNPRSFIDEVCYDSMCFVNVRVERLLLFSIFGYGHDLQNAEMNV